MQNSMTAKIAPGPKGRGLLGILPEAKRDLLYLLARSRNEYGDVVRLPAGPRQYYLVSSDTGLRRVLLEKTQIYPKSSVDKALFGNGLLKSEGELWKRQHRLYQPAFSRTYLQGFIPMMAEAASRMGDRWEAHGRGASLDIAEEMSRLTLEIAGRALFNMDLTADSIAIRDAMVRIFEHVIWKAKNPVSLPGWVPTPRNVRFSRAMASFRGVVRGIIQERKRIGVDDGSLLSKLIASKDPETGLSMDDDLLEDEVINILVAGHETTANSLTWTFYLLSKHPEAYAKVRAEIEAKAAGRDLDDSVLSGLHYTTMVLKESMRLYPPSWYLERIAATDDVIDGFLIPKGARVIYSPYVIHRHSGYWENPEGFQPERFLPENVEKRPKLAYIPFGAGARQCIGNFFAMQEALAVLATVIPRFKLDVVPGYPVAPEPLIILRPRHGIRMQLHRLGESPPPAGSGNRDAAAIHAGGKCPFHHGG